jgi:hypothetical protein
MLGRTLRLTAQERPPISFNVVALLTEILHPTGLGFGKVKTN